MPTSLEFLIGLLESSYPAYIAWEDFEGPHAEALELWQRMGFISSEPGMNPVPSCPHCEEGTPYRLWERYLCNACHSTVDLRYLQLWPLLLDAFLQWLSAQLELQGGVRSGDGQLWQLGNRTLDGTRHEVFFCRGGALTEAEKRRMTAFRDVLLIYGRTRPPDGDGAVNSLSLLDVLELDGALTVADWSALLETRGTVAFDPSRGVLWVGRTQLGEVPVGSREHAFLACLAQHRGVVVPYADIKRYVGQRSGSRDSTEEATFCQLLKNRLKKKWGPRVDRLITAGNKGEGYRLQEIIEAL